MNAIATQTRPTFDRTNDFSPTSTTHANAGHAGRARAAESVWQRVFDLLITLAFSLVSLVMVAVLLGAVVVALPWLLLLPAMLVGLAISAIGALLGAAVIL